MRTHLLTVGIWASCAIGAIAGTRFQAQSNGAILGRVEDENGAVVAGANGTGRNLATSMDLVSQTDTQSNYQVVALPVSLYRIGGPRAAFSESKFPVSRNSPTILLAPCGEGQRSEFDAIKSELS